MFNLETTTVEVAGCEILVINGQPWPRTLPTTMFAFYAVINAMKAIGINDIRLEEKINEFSKEYYDNIDRQRLAD